MRIFMFALLAFSLAGGANAQTAPDISGNWTRGDGNARVNVAACGDQICAVNTWVKDSSEGEAVGDKLVLSVKPDGPSTLSGSAYDQKRDLKYSMKISVTSDQMQTQGCVLGGIICKSISWSRSK